VGAWERGGEGRGARGEGRGARGEGRGARGEGARGRGREGARGRGARGARGEGARGRGARERGSEGARGRGGEGAWGRGSLSPILLAATAVSPASLESSGSSNSTDYFRPENAGKSIHSALNEDEAAGIGFCFTNY
jgi:hypothetical protein